MKFFSSKPKVKKKKSNTIIERVVLPILNRHLRTPAERLHGKVEKDGAVMWYRDGILHHATQAAITWQDGSYQWYINGNLHREDGPAAESQGNKYWYNEGKRHRTDGPAVEFANGIKEWWLDGEQITEQDFLNYLEEKNKKSF